MIEPLPMRRRPYLLAAMLGTLAIMIVELVMVGRRTRWESFYTLDDAYIQMAIAKNLVLHGVWGNTRYEFVGVGSSLLWPVINAALFKIFGIRHFLPLLLNLALGLAFVPILFKTIEERLGDARFTLALTLFTVLAMPIVPVAFTGMEHVLQSLLALLLFRTAMRFFRDDAPSTAASVALGALSALAVATRYELMAVVFVLSVFLVTQGRAALAAAMLGCGAVPILVYALFSTLAGGLPVPNPVLLKSVSDGAHPIFGVFTALIPRMTRDVRYLQVLGLLFITILVAVGLRGSGERYARARLENAILGTIVAVHIVFGAVGHFYRYEMYLFALTLAGSGAIGLRLLLDAKARARRAAAPFFLAAGLIALGLGVRALRAHAQTPVAAKNILDQQVQMARFIHRYHDEASIVLQDIGAVSFFSDARIFDVVGLGTTAVARARREGRPVEDVIRAQVGPGSAHPAVMAAIYWRDEANLFMQPVCVGSLTIQNNTICGGDRVFFHAYNGSSTERLREELREFARTVPGDVSILVE